ncbi:MAG TPA: ABC transporter permease [Allosphingosinicella sp.]|nr:ABC transporter permease [Allosphingosinicella sp.]
MLSALSAEALKMRTHKATWSLVWMFPILFSVIFLIAVGIGLAGLEQPATQSLPEWLEDTALIWNIPGNSIGRYLIAAFVAVVFAGEYGWNTWKLIVPHRSRTSLIAAKYALIVILFAISFLLTALISILGIWARDVAVGSPLPAGITASVLLELHGKQSLAAIAPVLVTIGYASLAALLTRSTIAALVISIVVTTIEQVIFSFGPALALNFSPTLIWPLYHGLPGYHLANLGNWIEQGAALRVEFPTSGIVELPWATSLAVVAAWLVATVGAAFAVFRRQDIN